MQVREPNGCVLWSFSLCGGTTSCPLRLSRSCLGGVRSEFQLPNNVVRVCRLNWAAFGVGKPVDGQLLPLLLTLLPVGNICLSLACGDTDIASRSHEWEENGCSFRLETSHNQHGHSLNCSAQALS